MEAKLVKSISELNQLSNINGYAEFYILLAGGLCRSWKRIKYYENTKYYDIYNEIDDTWQDEITEDQLLKNTIILEAIQKHAMFYTGCQLNRIEKN